MSRDYWLGFATPFVFVALVYVTIRTLATIGYWLKLNGWFVEMGRAPKSEVTFFSRLTVRGGHGFYLGLYRTTSGWGSRWVAVGPVTVGRKSLALALADKPPVSERTRPGADQSWEWGGQS